ncbi:MAG: inorganic phosphate transporter [Bacilli bacterium]|nr:inorganic phosphate transporter [Bacilli bacterium]
MSIPDYFTSGIANPWIFIASLLTLGVVFINGWNDAPNSIATAVSTRTITPKKAIILAAIFNALGVIVVGLLTYVISNSSVAGTIASIVKLPQDAAGNYMATESLIIISAATMSILVFSIGATILGFPTSESNELVGGLTGAGIAFALINAESAPLSRIGWDKWALVLGGLIGSIVAGFFLGFFFVRLIELICQKMTRSRTTKFFEAGQVLSSCLMAVMHGVQDGLKFMGVFLMILAAAKGSGSISLIVPWWIVLLVAAAMFAGTSAGGYKIIKNVGMGMAKLEKYQACATDLGGVVGLWAATMFSIPVSTGQVKMSAILGSGATKGIKRVRWDVGGRMILTWFITLPGSALVGGLLSAALLAIFC